LLFLITRSDFGVDDLFEPGPVRVERRLINKAEFQIVLTLLYELRVGFRTIQPCLDRCILYPSTPHFATRGLRVKRNKAKRVRSRVSRRNKTGAVSGTRGISLNIYQIGVIAVKARRERTRLCTTFNGTLELTTPSFPSLPSTSTSFSILPS